MSTTSVSTRTVYQHILSPSRRKKTHKKCIPVIVPPFGLSRTCTSPLLQQISDSVYCCKQLIPSLSIHHLLTSETIDQIDSIVNSEFPNVASTSSNQFFLDSKLYIKQLGDAARIISVAGSIHAKINSHLKHHDALPSDNVALIDLKTLYERIIEKKLAVENSLWTALDDHPEQTEAKLRDLMAQTYSESFQGKFTHVKFSDFRTLGVGRWLDDKVVNYFVEKWCSNTGTTLGLNLFFATRHLFKPGTCIPKDGYLTADNQARAKAWCSKAAERLGLRTWDSVFIPINEDWLHWFSAHINFRRKKINIYNSLKDRYIENHQKPPLLRKNANLMLMLLWLTETLSSVRGKRVELQDKLGSGWVCDPHFEVHFQPNSYDCGVHMLWHLRHILEFRHITPGHKCRPSHLKFTNNMVGKRLRVQCMVCTAGRYAKKQLKKAQMLAVEQHPKIHPSMSLKMLCSNRVLKSNDPGLSWSTLSSTLLPVKIRRGSVIRFIALLTVGTHQSTFQTFKSTAECLVDKLMNAAKANLNLHLQTSTLVFRKFSQVGKIAIPDMNNDEDEFLKDIGGHHKTTRKRPTPAAEPSGSEGSDGGSDGNNDGDESEGDSEGESKGRGAAKNMGPAYLILLPSLYSFCSLILS
ncbi:hypothetical protein D9757_008919 [Collybiopsis confluens]|uniref:Ubiquitin-like protease family profile domain-containing protein n=1 Tax=Collybiopsis confluens TaxID=2823264 RepID=A0A8H5HFC8_9AGAR|nr:hypothetical protein D9757_008919 [Collybiopsis confluens]